MSSETNKYKIKLKDKKTHEKSLELIFKLAHKWLTEKDEAKPSLRYITKRVPKELHDKFMFGYFPAENSSVFEFLDELGQLTKDDPVKILEETKVSSFKYKNGKGNSSFYYHNPLLIPFYNAYNKPISAAGRTLLSEEEMKEKGISKYKNLPFPRSMHVFGLNWAVKHILKQNKVILVEGQFDLTSMIAHKYKHTVALCSASLGEDQIILLKRYTNNFYVLFDNDEAGEKGWKSIKRRASQYNINPTRLSLPDAFHDIDECLQKNPSALSQIKEFSNG